MKVKLGFSIDKAPRLARRCTTQRRGLGHRLNSIAGHAWTVVPALLSLMSSQIENVRKFETVLQDRALGPVKLTGLLSEVPGSDTIVAIVHGLSGNASSPYCNDAARAAAKAGLSSLRLSLRGADSSGDDILHGGITQDVGAALAAPELAHYRHVLLIGFSVGGHIVLKAAVEQVDPRVRGAAAICPPLDLKRAADAFDHPARSLYRKFIFRGLNKAYPATPARGRVQVPPPVLPPPKTRPAPAFL